MRLGVVINPLAGIGGSVALKGSDGSVIVERALAKGAEPMAPQRTVSALRQLSVEMTDGSDRVILTASGEMGATSIEQAGLPFEVVYTASADRTTAQDTQAAVKALCAHDIDLLLFAGGDGTARDILNALQACGRADSLPVVGIPAGCKIHSAVYAVTPVQAGELVALLEQGQPLSVKMAEVMDLDEDAFRQGVVKASCYGYLPVPVDDVRMQAMKQGGVDHEAVAVEDIAADIVEHMQSDCLYLIGSGSTTAAVMEALGLPNTLLGIDAVMNAELVASDVDEQTMLKLLDGKPGRIVVTAIGGQGHIFGRGNQQFSPRVIQKVGLDNIVIIASNEKLRSLNNRPLRVDTGDSELDQQLSGVVNVVTGYEQRTLYRIN